MSLDDFNRIKVIGKGSYGEVWLANHKKDCKKQYVLKKMNLQKASKRERKSAELEAKLLSKLKHPNIVSYKDSFETENGYLYIAMQYCEGGDLYNKLKDQKGVPLEERQVVEWFIQISMALQYLHERNILHRDLKTQNIFLTKSKIIKIGDLGIARVLESSNDMASTLIGTPYYMSPELFSNKQYNHKSDVWALGCCVYEMATLKHAFNAKDMNALVYKILQGKMPAMPKKYSVELLSLIKQMLHQDPNKRPSVNKILRDPYIKKNIQIFLDDTKKNCRPSTSGKSRPGSTVSVRSVSSVVPSVTVSSSNNYSQSKVVATPSVVVTSPQAALLCSSSYTKSESTKPSPSSSSLSSETPIDSKPLNVDCSDQVDSVPVSHNLPDEHNRRPSSASRNSSRQGLSQNSSCSDLEPIEEKIHIPPSGNASGHINSDQIFDAERSNSKVEEKKKKGDTTQKKRPYLKRLKSKGEENDDNSDACSISSVKSYSSTKSIFKNPKPVEKHRPLPTPKAVESSGLPHQRNEHKESKSTESSSVSSGVSSSKEEGEIDTSVHSSLPNLSARERRRVKTSISSSADHSNCAKIKLRRPAERRLSEKITQSERHQMDAENVFPSVVKKPIRQPSIIDESSSSSEDLLVAGDSKEIEKRRFQTYIIDKNSPVDCRCHPDSRENKEMNNFITLLNTTLHQEKEKNDEDDEDDEAETLKPIEEIPVEDKDIVDHHPATKPLLKPSDTMHKSMSMPSIETLCDNSRLMKRIQHLHTDCVKGVGYEKIKEAYKILNKIDEDEVEPKLLALLGKDKYDEYAGKIWQLKFCEESLFLPS